jgi:hypothetical protein
MASAPGGLAVTTDTDAFALASIDEAIDHVRGSRTAPHLILE